MEQTILFYKEIIVLYQNPNHPDSNVQFKSRYANYINGEWIAPKSGEYFKNISPINGQAYCDIPRSNSADIELAVNAAQQAKKTWGQKSVAERAHCLNEIADRLEQNLEMLAVAESWDNGKPVRETLAADLPLAIYPSLMELRI